MAAGGRASPEPGAAASYSIWHGFATLGVGGPAAARLLLAASGLAATAALFVRPTAFCQYVTAALGPVIAGYGLNLVLESVGRDYTALAGSYLLIAAGGAILHRFTDRRARRRSRPRSEEFVQT